MRRAFLRVLATAAPFLLWGKRATAQAARQAEPPPDRDTFAGTWHLLRIDEDEVNVPNHRMDLRFTSESGQLKGAIVNRVTGGDIPLAETTFDGSTLRVVLEAPPDKPQAEMPTLVLRWTESRFEGGYRSPGGAPLGIKLKLVRARRVR